GPPGGAGGRPSVTVSPPPGPRPGDPGPPQRREERSPTASASPVGESAERPLTTASGTPVAAGASSIPATQAAAPGASGEMPGTRRHAPSTLARPARLRASRRVRLGRLIGQARVPEQEGAAR
ncbi:hypothetical protein ACFWJI_42695, partial [Streptomyces griseorubiginosus]